MDMSFFAGIEDTTNACCRASRLLLGPCTDELRDVLRYHVPPSIFPHVIVQNWSNLPRMTAPQMNLILPRDGSYTGNYNDMDISLLYILLRNICSIPPHSKGWGNDPDSTDRSLSANIERIRIARNQLAMQSGPFIFNTFWSTVRSAVVDIDSFLNNGNLYQRHVDILRYETMDPERDYHFTEELRKQAEEDAAIRETAHGLKFKFEESETDLIENQNLMQNIIEWGTVVNPQAEGDTKLIAACQAGNLSVVKELIEAGADVNLQSTYETPLTAACRDGHMRVVKELLKAGADINLKVADDTPVEVALKRGHISVVRMLSEAGANVNNEEKIYKHKVLLRLSQEIQNRYKCTQIIRMYVGEEKNSISTKNIIVVVFDGANNFDFETWEGYQLRWKQWRCPSPEGAYISSYDRNESFNVKKVHDMEMVIKRNANLLFKDHSNLEVVSISAYRYQKNADVLKQQWCIALYCSCKGVVPLTEKEFPESIEEFKTDVREGFFYLFPNGAEENFFKSPSHVLKPLVMGCSIGRKDSDYQGTLGGFVSFDNGAGQERGFITTAHTFFDQAQTSNIEIVQPSYGIQNENNVCGIHIRSVFPTQMDEHGVSVDASLIKITDRFPDRGTFSGYTVVDIKDLGFTKERPPEYDTDDIRDYRDERHVKERRNTCCKSGASSGFTKGELKINGLAAKYHDPSVPFSNPPTFCGYYYYSQLEIHHLKGLKDFSQPGDSGALVFQIDPQGLDNDDKLVCIGMVVGGTSFNTSVVTPIASILQALDIQILPLKPETMEF